MLYFNRPQKIPKRAIAIPQACFVKLQRCGLYGDNFYPTGSAIMPKKIKELKSMLRKAGFIWRPGKGSHTVWKHPLLPKPVVISGNDGSDAQQYQEKDVDEALKKLEELS